MKGSVSGGLPGWLDRVQPSESVVWGGAALVVGAPAAEKPGAVSLIFQVADRFPFGDDHVRRPDLRLAVRSWPARREQSAELGNKFRLHKQFGKSGVSRIGGRRRQNVFGVRRQLDFADSCSKIRDRHPPYFGVVLRRNHDFKCSPNCAIAPPDLDVIFGKNDFIGIRFDAGWLVCSRPNLAGRWRQQLLAEWCQLGCWHSTNRGRRAHFCRKHSHGQHQRFPRRHPIRRHWLQQSGGGVHAVG